MERLPGGKAGATLNAGVVTTAEVSLNSCVIAIPIEAKLREVLIHARSSRFHYCSINILDWDARTRRLKGTDTFAHLPDDPEQRCLCSLIRRPPSAASH